MSIVNSIRSQMVPISPEGYPFIGIFALVTIFLFWVWTPLGWIGALLTIWCVLFFRDPPRVTPMRDGVIVAPADGTISMVTSAAPPRELGLRRQVAAARLDLHERVQLSHQPQPGDGAR